MAKETSTVRYMDLSTLIDTGIQLAVRDTGALGPCTEFASINKMANVRIVQQQLVIKTRDMESLDIATSSLNNIRD
jgi:hypothetical protein